MNPADDWDSGCIASAVRMSIFFRKNVYEDPTCEHPKQIGWCSVGCWLFIG